MLQASVLGLGLEGLFFSPVQGFRASGFRGFRV